MQLKILEKTTRFGVFNSQTIQNTETATDRSSTEIAIHKYFSSESQHFWKYGQKFILVNFQF